MTLRMADGLPANLPAGLQAYAGYVDDGGDGITYPTVLADFPTARHLSISVHGAPAMCADVENGALNSWKGYTVGYCSVSRADVLVQLDGRPRKLWTAHYTGVPHICGPACGLTSTTADATQWTDHGGVWDESLLLDDFFDFQTPTPEPDVLDANDQAWIAAQLNHYFTLVLFGDSEDAAQGKTTQGHPFNLYQIKQELDAVKAELDALKAAGGSPAKYTGTINLTPG